MRRFELRKIARKIVKLEKIIHNGSPEERSRAEDEIRLLTINHNLNPIDMITIDEMVQNMLESSDFTK